MDAVKKSNHDCFSFSQRKKIPIARNKSRGKAARSRLPGNTVAKAPQPRKAARAHPEENSHACFFSGPLCYIRTAPHALTGTQENPDGSEPEAPVADVPECAS
jgi:hypothetical protein